MAKAFVLRIDNVTGHTDGTFVVDMTIVFSGSDVGGGTDLSPITVTLDGSDTPVDIKNKISDGIFAEATRIGYTLAKNNMIIPDFQKGN